MRIALFSDIHGNREAFATCLDHARRQAPDRFVLLGDYVGYGADPEWVVRQVMELVGQGALALLGNHDEAVFNPSSRMNPSASAAMAWTRLQLSPEAMRFLRSLPLEEEEEDRL